MQHQTKRADAGLDPLVCTHGNCKKLQTGESEFCDRHDLWELEKKARLMTTCPKCGEKKASGEHSQIVCWGDCWHGEGGLKYTQLDTEQWLKENTNLSNK